MQNVLRAMLVPVLALLATGPVRAQTTYKIQPIVKLGDTVGDVKIKASGGDFEIGTLNDAGYLVFIADTDPPAEALFQYADGKLTPIVVAGREAPTQSGKWPERVGIVFGVSMNQTGNAVFAVGPFVNNNFTVEGTFLWDFKTQKVTAVALKGMPAVNDLTFERGGDFIPIINSSNEIAFPAAIKNAAGQARTGVFFLGRDGKLLPVALPDQELPGGKKIDFATLVSLTDGGRIGFQAFRKGENGASSAYTWENGTISPVAAVGSDVPGGSGKFAWVAGPWLNNNNGNALVAAGTPGNGNNGLYLLAGGTLHPVAVPGQDLPGGGKLRTVVMPNPSYANDAGQHVFLAQITEESRTRTAAYLMDADGKLSLILKSGTTTDLGTVTHVGVPGSTPPSLGVGLNNKGQVALPVRFDNGPATIVLLTP